MKIYLVGGAVRDQLLGKAIKERDWVVVGSTADELLAQGFVPVGKDFPVFLHPKTHEEYALARTERKISKGYKGFTFHAAPDVTLEQDLLRRDLTINAMAQAEDGTLIDPYGGQKDLTSRILRHVSPAFAEDPVRILRAARFAALLPDFHLHPETLLLMQRLVAAGEVDALVAERVWQEMEKALRTETPSRFFEMLAACGALEKLFPSLCPHLSLRLKQLHKACALSTKTTVRFAALFSESTESELKTVCQRYRVPKDYQSLTHLALQQKHLYHTLLLAEAKTVLDFLLKADALRRPDRFADLLVVCEAVASTSTVECEKINALLMAALHKIQQVDIKPLLAQGLVGDALVAAIYQARLNLLLTKS